MSGIKTFKLDRGLYTGAPHNPATIDISFCIKEFGVGGVQQERRWFYRLINDRESWRRVGRRSSLRMRLYFRSEADRTLFLLKRC